MAIVWKGGWTSDGNGLSDTTYYEDEVVSHLNVSYIAKAEVAIGSPVPSSDMSNWDTFVSGAIGTSGTSGTSGTTGTSGTSGFGVPTGGTSGQILVKNSSTSGDASWADRAIYGRTAMTNTIPVLASQTATIMEFTIPSAGVWEVNYNVRTRTTARDTYATIFLADTANAQIANTSTFLTMYFVGVSGQKQATNGAGTPLDIYVNNVPLGFSDFQMNTRGTDFLTTTGQTTYRIRMVSQGGTTQALSDANGNTAVWFKKIG
jgi:hypothetical protein